MKTSLIILLLFTVTHGFGHDIKKATFEISKSSNGLSMEIEFDRGDLEKSIRITYPERSRDSSIANWNELIRMYLESNLQILINDDCVELEYQKYDYEDDHIHVKTNLPFKASKISSINIFNTCLIDYNKGHMNIVTANLMGRKRTFRLSEQRVSTVIDYANL